MNTVEMKKLTAHFNKYFEQSESEVLHPIVMDPHIDVLLYKPTDKYPFWKLATMGASDYKMSGKNALGDRNEYMIFVDADENLSDKEELMWYRSKLLEVALYPHTNNAFISYGHCVEWTPEPNEEMVGAFIVFPEEIKGTGILKCELGPFKTAVCLQITLLNRAEMELLMEIGPQQFSEFLYPEHSGRGHFLSQRNRTDKF